MEKNLVFNELIVNRDICMNLIQLIINEELKGMLIQMDLELYWNGDVDRDDKDYNMSFISDSRFVKKQITFEELLHDNDGKIPCGLVFPKIFIYNDFFKRMTYYSSEHLDFDFDKYSEDNDIDIMHVYFMFAMLHEIGHLIHYFYELEEYGYPKTIQEEYFNPRKTSGFVSYRNQKSEFIADKLAVNALNKFIKEIKHCISLGCVE